MDFFKNLWYTKTMIGTYFLIVKLLGGIYNG